MREELALVGDRYPRREVGVVFPIEPEGFFVRQISAPAKVAGPERTHTEAA